MALKESWETQVETMNPSKSQKQALKFNAITKLEFTITHFLALGAAA